MEKCQDSTCCHPVKYSLRNGLDPGWPEAGIGQELWFNISPLNLGIVFSSPEVFKLDFSHEILYTNKILGISPRSKQSRPGQPHTKHCPPAYPWLASPCFYPFPPPGTYLSSVALGCVLGLLETCWSLTSRKLPPLALQLGARGAEKVSSLTWEPFVPAF